MTKWFEEASVTGGAKMCGPCALSAITGVSSEVWPDEDMQFDQMFHILELHYGRQLEKFNLYCEKTGSLISLKLFFHSDFLSAYPDLELRPGLWLLSLTTGAIEGVLGHAVAVFVQEISGGHRCTLLDSRFRHHPFALSSVCKLNDYRYWRLAKGCHVGEQFTYGINGWQPV